MNEKPKDFYSVFAPDVPSVRVISGRFASEADARRRKWEILMSYPAADVRIEKTDESGRVGDPRSEKRPGWPTLALCFSQGWACLTLASIPFPFNHFQKSQLFLDKYSADVVT